MRLRRSLKLAAAILVAAALGVSAASAVVRQQVDPTPQSPEPVPGSDSIDRTAPDPDGGPDWAVRVYASTTGGSCVELGRISDGRFGQLNSSGSFYDIPLDQGGTCGDLTAEPVILAVNTYPSRERQEARTVLFGRSRTTIADVLVAKPDGSSEAHPGRGPAGGFLRPLAGTIPPSDLPTTITLDDGRQVTYDWE